MIDQEILEYNKRCAEFLGWKYSQNYDCYDDYCFEWDKREDGVWYKEENLVLNPKSYHQYYVKVDGVCLSDYEYTLKFHSDWNFIMDMVEAIEKLGFNFNIYHQDCIISRNKKWIVVTHAIKVKTKKDAVVQSINEFLIWYNKQEKL